MVSAADMQRSRPAVSRQQAYTRRAGLAAVTFPLALLQLAPAED